MEERKKKKKGGRGVGGEEQEDIFDFYNQEDEGKGDEEEDYLDFYNRTIYKDKLEILQFFSTNKFMEKDEEEAVRSSLISYLHSGTI